MKPIKIQDVDYLVKSLEEKGFQVEVNKSKTRYSILPKLTKFKRFLWIIGLIEDSAWVKFNKKDKIYYFDTDYNFMDLEYSQIFCILDIVDKHVIK
jgi:hypothetical protein